MLIYLISRGYPNSNDPLWGSFEALQAKALTQLGHKVIIFALDGRIRFYKRKYGISYNINDDIPTYIYRLLPFKLISFSPRLLVECKKTMMSRLFKKAVKRYGMPDIIYAHYLFNIETSVGLKGFEHIPVVGIEHWSELAKPVIPKDIYKTASKVYPLCDKILAVSPGLRDIINEKFKVSADYVPNMIDYTFCNLPDIGHESNKTFEFISIGRLVDWKGFETLIKAAAKLKDENTAFHITIVGQGEKFNYLHSLIRSLELEEYVVLVGQKTKEEIRMYLKSSDAFVLPSEHETFGVVFIEALAMGMPVIGCNYGGPTTFVTEDNGILVPPKDVTSIANAMKNLMNNRDKYDSVKISRDCLNKYSPDKVAQRIDEVFKTISSNSR